MDKKIDELEEEISYLKKRIDVLEKGERKRKAAKSMKIIIKIIIYGCLIFGILKAYDYIKNEIPNMINEEVDNVTNNIKGKIKNIKPSE